MHDDTNALVRPNPLWSPWAFLLAGLALSIGWGIRGNYGHETGAMFPGALAAIAICLLSGRQEWRERVAFFACFGALGWAFGGSMSYMQVLAYSQSGHAPSQFYGFYALFGLGFLWGALGGAGTALPAVLDRRSLNEIFQPLSLLLALWCLLYFVEEPLSRIVQAQFGLGLSGGGGARRHESVLYWLDSSWLSVFVMLIGILAFDLADRRFTHSLWLPAMAAVGGILGGLVQIGIGRGGFADWLHDVLVHVQGPRTGFDSSRLITNWPVLFAKGSDYIGAALGVMLGTGVYFFCFGKFRRGSSLFLHMALGWFAGFLLLPVLLDVRMTPPRGDNWAGIVGVYAGVLIWSLRHHLRPIVVASLVTGAIGGIGLSLISCVQAILMSFGNGNLGSGMGAAWSQWQTHGSPTDVLPGFLLHAHPAPAWQFWQQANWHSFLEQSYGFINGIGLIVAMALLAQRMEPLENTAKRKYGPELVALTLVLPVLLYVNLIKNVAVWTHTTPAHAIAAMPKAMRMPLIGFPLSAYGWFDMLFGLAALALVMLLSVHTRRRLALLEQSWLGRGQLLFVVLLWAFVVGNFGMELSGFTEQRLLTEGVVTVNAVLATMMIFLLPENTPDALVARPSNDFGRLIGMSVLGTLLCAAILPPIETLIVRAVYADAPVHRAGPNVPETRFGPHATWKRSPLLRGADHK